LNAVSSTVFFKALRLLDCPRLVGLVHEVVSLCFKEEGILGLRLSGRRNTKNKGLTLRETARWYTI